jgi:uncharacterized membrane protein SpoIIM required for sporulation
MFEIWLFEAEKNQQVGRIFLFTVVATFIIGYLNQFIGGNMLFLVSLVALMLAYPVVKYVRSMDKEELDERMQKRRLFARHGNELVVFWTIFVAATIGLLAAIPFQSDFTYQQAFVNQLTGYVTNNIGFEEVLLNNLEVMAFTFVLSIISFSAVVFVLLWNASIVAYVLTQITSGTNAFLTGFGMLPHGLLEIGGYVMAGIAGSILALRFDRKKKLDADINERFWKDFLMLIGMAIGLVVLGAVLETV